MRFVRALGPTLVLLSGAATLGTACRGATEIVVDIRTNLPCAAPAEWQGIAVYEGSPGLDVETKSPTLTSSACDASGHVGSIVLVPSASKDATVSVRVVAGITRRPEDCAAAGYKGCVVARRTLGFLAHQAVNLTIDLTGDCLGQACDALRTCVSGVCTDARLVQPGGADAAPSSGPRVRCGDDSSNTCPVSDPSNACCVNVVAGKITAAGCKPSVECVQPSVVLQCDKASDCAGSHDEKGKPYVCCVYNAGGSPDRNSQCLPHDTCDLPYGFKTSLCNDHVACEDGTRQCRLQLGALPGYYSCDY